MKKPRLWNCHMKGHVLDTDYPTQTVGSRAQRPDGTVKFFAYSMGRCLQCGCFYSMKGEAEAPKGIVNPAGQVVA